MLNTLPSIVVELFEVSGGLSATEVSGGMTVVAVEFVMVRVGEEAERYAVQENKNQAKRNMSK